MSRNKAVQKQTARFVPRFTIEQALDLHVVYDTWAESNAQDSQRTITDKDGRKVHMKRTGKSLGYSVSSAAKRLSISRQRVHQLVKSKTLEAYELLDDAKASAGLFVSTRSVEAFRLSERKPGPKAKA